MIESNRKLADLKIAKLAAEIDNGVEHSNEKDEEKFKKLEERIKKLEEKGEKDKSYRDALISERKENSKEVHIEKVIIRENEKQIEDKDTADRDDVDEEIDDAQKKIGFYPMTADHIARYARKEHDLFNVSNND